MSIKMITEGRYNFKIIKSDYDENKSKFYLLLKSDNGCYFPLKVYLIDYFGKRDERKIWYVINIIRSAINNKRIYEINAELISMLVGKSIAATISYSDYLEKGYSKINLGNITSCENDGE